MAGHPLGASAPALPASGASRPVLHLSAASTRTRRSHGAFPLGDLIASVYSSRRDRDGRVTLGVGHDTVRLDLCMSPQQALAMAQVLMVAARAAEVQVAPGDVRLQSTAITDIGSLGAGRQA